MSVVMKSYAEFKDTVLRASRGEKTDVTPNTHYVESAEALVRLLTRENRDLLRVIRDQKPQSVAELARMTSRAEPNLLRTLEKLAMLGFVEMRQESRRRVPIATARRFTIEIDPYSHADQLISS